MAVDDNAAMLLKRFGSLENQRQTWESHWQEIADYVVPRKADVTKVRSPGDKRSELIFDGTAIHAAELLSASLHVSAARPCRPALRASHPCSGLWHRGRDRLVAR